MKANFKKIVLLLTLSLSIFAAEALDKKDTKIMLDALKKNESLFQTFFQFNAKEVNKLSLDLKTTLEKVSDSEVKSILKVSIEKLTEMATLDDEAKLKQNYHMVSTALILINQRYKISSDHKAYYCPMVRKKWIQNVSTQGKPVKNPYDSSMPDCGGML